MFEPDKPEPNSSEPAKRKKVGLRIAVISGVAAVFAGAGAAWLSASAQEQAQPAADEPLTYQRVPTETARPTDTVATETAPINRVVTAKPVATTFRGDVVAGKPIMLRRPMPPAKVNWQSAMDQSDRMQKQSSTQRTAAPSLKARLPRQQLDKTRLPVILPREGGVVDTAKAKMMSFGDAYALNMPQPQKDGVQVTVYGNRTFVAGESGAVSKRPFARLAGVAEDVRIGQMEDGWTATFTRYGVVYSIDVSCDSLNTPDCKTDTYIRNVIAQMDDVTMGTEAQAEAETQIKQDNSWLNQVSKTISNITKGS